MVYHLTGGSRDYDPSLQAEPSTTWQEMDGDFAQVFVNDPTPDGGGRISRVTYHVGRPIIVDQNIPTKLRRGGPNIKRAKLLDVNRYSGSLDLVNQTFKDIVEEFEPGVHQFFPMDYFDAKGEEKIGEGYLMIICQRLDTLHDTLCIPPRNDRGFVDRRNPAYADRDESLDRVVFSKEKIKGHHMWHDKFHGRSNLFSNALAERLIAANLSGLKAKNMARHRPYSRFIQRWS
jgi:hypothetical protein